MTHRSPFGSAPRGDKYRGVLRGVKARGSPAGPILSAMSARTCATLVMLVSNALILWNARHTLRDPETLSFFGTTLAVAAAALFVGSAVALVIRAVRRFSPDDQVRLTR